MVLKNLNIKVNIMYAMKHRKAVQARMHIIPIFGGGGGGGGGGGIELSKE